MKKKLFTENAPKPIGPYSQAIEFGSLIYTCGQIALGAGGNVISDDIKEQTRVVCTNLKNILEENGSSLENVIKTTVFLKSMDDFTAMNGVYAEFFGTSAPARSTVEVARLPKDVKVEIELIAHK